MSKALEIAQERFAQGEITKEEFEEIKASLAVPESTANENVSKSTKSDESASGCGIISIIFTVFVLFVVYSFIQFIFDAARP